ncbi:MAG: glutamine synthetase [Clostridiales Family XIII bacterium]|nr:glutamine synthetase [Clostridiales Family XIII bacterium]
MQKDLLYTIPADKHTPEEVLGILCAHPEVKFVSLVGIDLGGHDTDEKIPVELFREEIQKFIYAGVQTDGSSVVLKHIATLNDAKVAIIPDTNVNWYVDYNFDNMTRLDKKPTGTLRIPSKLVHGVSEVGSREVLARARDYINDRVLELIKAHPYIINHTFGLKNIEDIDHIELTGATELEFWVYSPEERADIAQLSTSQELKEQYWQRTRGSVRLALERTITLMNKFGFQVEMGHKEVGGVKAKLRLDGTYGHIMEQLEIDWTYADALQAADNELHIRNLVKDVFRMHELDVTFLAKPMEDVAGSGEHTHMGMVAVLKDGEKVNIFSPKDMRESFMSPIGYGAIMGLLKNYEVVGSFVAADSDALNRLKPGFEAPVSIVTSLGHSPDEPSRNRTVLAGLVREEDAPSSTRFELRAPCPKANTYLIMAASYMSMMDGIEAVFAKELTETELLPAISKKKGETAFYLDKDRVYRTEEDVFEDFTEEQREELFGVAPKTAYESIGALSVYKEKRAVLCKGNVFTESLITSYEDSLIERWSYELKLRTVSDALSLIRDTKKVHDESCGSELDEVNWREINDLRHYIAKNMMDTDSLLERIRAAVADESYDEASDLEIELRKMIRLLRSLYEKYTNNII